MRSASRLWGFPAVLVPLTVLAGLAAPAATSAQGVGVFEGQTDVGMPALPGRATYDVEAQSYLVEGAGANIWSDRDEFRLVWKRMTGDFILRARTEFQGQGVDPHRKMGWMVRAGLAPDAAYVDLAVHGDGLTALQFRRAAAGETEELRSPVTGPDVIQLSRRNWSAVRPSPCTARST